MDRAKGLFPRLAQLWMDGGYTAEGKGADWLQKTFGWSVQIVSRPRRPALEEVLLAWAKEWAKEGVTKWTGRNSCQRRVSSSCHVGGS